MKIFVQQIDDKFMNNLIISLRQMDHETISTVVNNNLYKLDYLYKFNLYIFVADLFSNEIAQFISEYHNKENYKFLIYYPSDTRYKELSDFNKVCKTCGHTSCYDIVIPSNLINDKIFIESKNTKEDFAAIFLEQYDKELPSELINCLYPNTMLPIKMFNNRNIVHYQNVGLLNEYNKAEVLQQARYYIVGQNDRYALEAIACGCDLIAINNIAKKSKNTKFVVDKKKTSDAKTQLKKSMTYKTFITEYIL